MAWFQSKQNLTTKQQTCADSKREYVSEVAKMKVVQNEHYNKAMPRIFQVRGNMSSPVLQSSCHVSCKMTVSGVLCTRVINQVYR